MTMDIRHGDALEVLCTLADNDPPYGLKFMAAKWDYEVPGTVVWALRIAGDVPLLAALLQAA